MNERHISDSVMGARQEGSKAFQDGMGIEDNPYPRFSEEHFAWMRGWHTAASMELLSKSR